MKTLDTVTDVDVLVSWLTTHNFDSFTFTDNYSVIHKQFG